MRLILDLPVDESSGEGQGTSGLRIQPDRAAKATARVGRTGRKRASNMASQEEVTNLQAKVA